MQKLTLDMFASEKVVRDAIKKQLPPKDQLVANAVVDLVMAMHYDMARIGKALERIADSHERMEPS